MRKLKKSENRDRTFLMEEYNPRVVKAKNGEPRVLIDGKPVPCITRNTRDFHISPLCSAGAGASNKREILYLNPSSLRMRLSYIKLLGKLKEKNIWDIAEPEKAPDPAIILQAVFELTRELLAPHGDNKGRVRSLRKGRKKVIPLDDFIEEKTGVCRHHGLLNAYFLSILVAMDVLKGEVICHRQNLRTARSGAHSWVVFKSEEGKLYSLDSFRDKLICITDEPGGLEESIYGSDAESTIHQRYGTAKQADKQGGLNRFVLGTDDINVKATETLGTIKKIIETKEWKVGGTVGLFLPLGGKNCEIKGRTRRLPHHVRDIYNTINEADFNVDEAKAILQVVKDIANQALKSKGSREPATQEFYQKTADISLTCTDQSQIDTSHPRSPGA